MPSYTTYITLLFFSVVILISATPNARIEMVEICDNGIDDDNDGLIDLIDDDCPCEITQPISLIPNPSFEELNCCPSQRSQLNCAVDWIQASEPTTDLIHTCDWLGWDEFPPPRPFPDGNSIMGFRDGRYSQEEGQIAGWKEYAGSCLLNPLLKDSTYRFQFDLGFASPSSSPPINITIFGTNDCVNLPFGEGNPDTGCPSNSPGWVHLGQRNISGGSGHKWVNTLIDVTPAEDIYAIAIGPSCQAPTATESLYYFFDNLILANIKFFDLDIITVNHYCATDFTLKVRHNNAFEYQWYKEGIALVGETSSNLSQNYGEGNYQVRIQDGSTCRLSTRFEYIKPEIFTEPTVTICEDDIYEFGELNLTESGTYVDTFTSVDNCDSIVTLNLRVLGEIIDTVSAKIFKGSKYRLDKYVFKDAGEYPIILNSSLGCDSLVLLQLELFTVFIPNIFSPNEDGINDTFGSLGESGLFRIKRMSIFDRWGSKMYEGANAEWDGTYLGSPVKEDVYLYEIIVGFTDGSEEAMLGTVTLIR
ncbi:T9SS type B sorting domain-containing protein [Portibacter lacus]|uniref:Gliding motility-associated C-terminal domain-containing protein n=1 Tax=Portibacter lacus TaxID=1099794 RepID=A0AA37SRK6_9BACT|nr:T9SS type B sorting domain-containing protein [Portibacter lacus]GLR16640.1 hypothetical protein GCM10007940_12550 [Portibacter lacus]